MKNVIRLGDPTSHGGKVTSSAAPHFVVDGLPVVLVGDSCTCPLPGHVGCVVVEGDPNDLIDGVPVAYNGHKASCGAQLISTLDSFSSE